MDIAKLADTLNMVARRSHREQLLELPEDIEVREEPRKKKRRKCLAYPSFYPILFPGRMGTPKSGQPYTSAIQGTVGMPSPVVSSWVPSSRVRVLHEMKKALGLLEFTGTGAGAVSWLGFAVPNPIMAKTRLGGPTIGGPGFANDPERDGRPSGGVYDPQRSPGLGFRTEKGWRIWKAAQEIMLVHPELPQSAIVQGAVARAGVKIGEVDPAEMRLVEMGVEWYLSDPDALAAKRGSGMAPAGGSTADPSVLGTQS